MCRIYWRTLLFGIVGRSEHTLPIQLAKDQADAWNKQYGFHAHYWAETSEWFEKRGRVVHLPNEHMPPKTWQMN